MSANRRTAGRWAVGFPVLVFLVLFTGYVSGQNPAATQSTTPPAPQTTAPAAATFQAPPAPDTDLPRFFKVGDGLAVGAKPTTTGIRKLSEMGFKTVLNLAALQEGSMIEAKTVEFYGLKFINLECNPESFTNEVLAEFAKVIQTKEDQPIYVHCRNGNKAAALWMIYRVKKEGWKLDAAQEEAGKMGLNDAAVKDAALKFCAKKA
jgi:protein tyrosine phosphatase (PTP) superfamily phosphohydrolase (DUF442 family)